MLFYMSMIFVLIFNDLLIHNIAVGAAMAFVGVTLFSAGKNAQVLRMSRG
jgi:hypothetical protein